MSQQEFHKQQLHRSYGKPCAGCGTALAEKNFTGKRIIGGYVMRVCDVCAVEQSTKAKQ